MTRKRHSRRAKARREARHRRRATVAGETTQPSPGQIGGGDDAKPTTVQAAEDTRPSFAEVLRIAFIVPLTLLVVALGIHQYWPWHTPQWFQSIADKEIEVLTLSAGHLVVIGLLITNNGRFKSGAYTLYVAAVAMAIVGFKRFADVVPDSVAVLILWTMPAIWAEGVSAILKSFWNSLRWWFITCILLGIGAGVAIEITIYMQARDENYIRDWILIPLGIVAVTAAIIWALLRLAYKFKAHYAAIRGRETSRRGKRRPRR